MTDQERVPADGPFTDNQSALERRWGHPLFRFLSGIGFWIALTTVGIGVIVVTLLTVFGLEIDGTWTIMTPAALIVFGYAVLFAFAGWYARRGR